MNYKIDDYEKILKKVSNITMVNYESDYYDCPVLLLALEDMLRAYKTKEEEFLEYKRYVNDNYKQIDVAEQYDIDDRDFI